MSAIAIELPVEPAGRMPRRPALRLVPAPATVEHRRLRLTTSGWVALVICAAVAVVMLIALTAGGAASGATHSVTVRAGETLSAVAVRELPQLSMREAVAAIQLANNLPSTEVSAGQVLTIPLG